MSATSSALPLIMLCTEAIYSLSVSIMAPYAVVFALYSRSFGHRKVVLQEIYVILAKFEAKGSEIAIFWFRMRAKILVEFTALIQKQVTTMHTSTAVTIVRKVN